MALSAGGKLALDGGRPAVAYKLPCAYDRTGRDIGREELAELEDVIASGTLGYLHGAKIGKLQDAFRRKFGMDAAVCVSSGTAAIHTAIVYLGLGPGDEVLVPAITDIGTVLGVVFQGATPVFVDVDPLTHNLDPADLERRVTARARAVIPVHLYGFPCDMDGVMAVAKRHGLIVVEDCAQAHHALYKGRLAGSIGDMAAFSFQQTKHMTAGEGGMVMSKRDCLRGRKLLHCHDKGWPREEYRDHLFPAPNYHFSELQAAVAVAQFAKLEGMVARRRQSALALSGMLRGVEGVCPPGDDGGTTHSFFAYNLPIRPAAFAVDSCVLARALCAEGVECYPGYIPRPIYMYDAIAKFAGGAPEPTPKAVEACRSALYIPWNERMTGEHAADICAALCKVFDHYRA